MSEFEKVFQEAYDFNIDDSCKHRYQSSKCFAQDIWDARKAEIDQLKVGCAKAMHLEIQHRTMLQDSLLEVEKLKAEKVELEKRVDDQIKKLGEAVTSLAYSEREKNIIQSQIDDMKALRGGHE